MSRTLTIYIPKPGSAIERQLAPGSGIVGEPHPSGVLLHYEGNLYGAANLQRYEERLKHAAGRLVGRYPTVAMMLLPAAEAADALVAVGEYDAQTWTAHFDAVQRQAIRRYSGEEV